MLRKSPFFDFLSRREDSDFEQFMAESIEDQDYIEWNGFALPMHYGDQKMEYLSVRNDCALCDVSPMRKIRIEGDQAGAFLDRLLTRPVTKLPAMKATYTVMCDDDGTLKDDAIIYKYADDDYLMMPSDIDHSPYFESVCERFGINCVSFTECTDAWIGLALQGPSSAAVMREMGFVDIEQLEPYEARDYELHEGVFHVSRMGFTADLGYECWIEPAILETLLQKIHDARAATNLSLPGYGLDALQACRLEGGFVVAGWDFSSEIDPQPGLERSPFEVGLAWLVDLESADFVGRDALVERQEKGHEYAIRYFSIDDGAQPDDGTVIHGDEVKRETSIGLITSSSWSLGLQKVIGNASIRTEHAGLESGWITLDGNSVCVRLSRRPLINLERRNQVPVAI